MKQTAIVFLILLVPVVWLLYRPKLAIFKARLGRGVRIAAVVYFLILAVRLSTSEINEEQLAMAGVLLLVFVGVWGVAWLVTRGIARTR